MDGMGLVSLNKGLIRLKKPLSPRLGTLGRKSVRLTVDQSSTKSWHGPSLVPAQWWWKTGSHSCWVQHWPCWEYLGCRWDANVHPKQKLQPPKQTWFTWKWTLGSSEIPDLETIISRFHINFWGCTARDNLKQNMLLCFGYTPEV